MKGSKNSVWQTIGGVLAGLLILALLVCAGYGIYSAVDKYVLTDTEQSQEEQEQEQTPETDGETEQEQTPETDGETEQGTDDGNDDVTVTALQNYEAEIEELAA